MRSFPRTFLVALLAASLLASACMSIPNSTGVHRLGSTAMAAADSGVVLFSAGAPGRCHTHATALTIEAAERGKSAGRIPPILVDGTLHKSDFTEYPGTLNAVQLSAGAYRLEPKIMNVFTVTTRRPVIEFDVRVGETVYAGELFVARSCSSPMLYQVRDRFDRDVAMAVEKNPALGVRPVVKRLMTVRPDPADARRDSARSRTGS